MKLVDYGPGFINVDLILRFYMKEESNGYGAAPTYVLIVETLDRNTYRFFEGRREACRKAMLDLVAKLGGKIV